MLPANCLRVIVAFLGTLLFVVGCGTTRTTNTMRTATEQLLISDAIDRAVQEIDFSVLEGESVFFDAVHINEVVDKEYLISSMRQHLLANGCSLKENRGEADYVVEPRVGAVGTDNHDLKFGIPATNIPQFGSSVTSTIPEITIAQRSQQRAVAKIAVFAYRRETGDPVWQSGMATSESTSNDIWVLGAGPFQKGTIHEGVEFAGKDLHESLGDSHEEEKPKLVKLNQEVVFGSKYRSDQQVYQTSALEAQQAGAKARGPRVLLPPSAFIK